MKDRYYSKWQYNRAILLNYLADIVENNGGELLTSANFNSYSDVYRIHDRTGYEKIREIESHIEFIKKISKLPAEKQETAISRLTAEKEEIEKQGDAPYETQLTSYIQFRYDGDYYYIEMDDNPLFPFHFMKTPISDDYTYSSCYLDDLDKKEWFYDCLLNERMNDAEHREIANLLFNCIATAKESEVVYENKPTRCPTCGRTMHRKREIWRIEKMRPTARTEKHGWELAAE